MDEPQLVQDVDAVQPRVVREAAGDAGRGRAGGGGGAVGPLLCKTSAGKFVKRTEIRSKNNTVKALVGLKYLGISIVRAGGISELAHTCKMYSSINRAHLKSDQTLGLLFSKKVPISDHFPVCIMF